ncbi:GNAT family N-acetyltransferase [Spongiactinospora sp. 9N601]|uniref:GNAT family N-acetyltransferase n=1 Tax=Spongiactinospora sp. 9N601 TaxID=3375149 RepID=UPI00378CC152
MEWAFCSEVTAFPEEAERWLRGDPIRNTVPLTLLVRLRLGQAAGGGLLGWLADGPAVRGLVVQTPLYPLVITDVPAESLEPLAAALRAHGLPGVTGPAPMAEAFARACGRPESGRMDQRLYHLAEPREPRAPGRARAAVPGDLDLLAGWYKAFLDESQPGHPCDDPAPGVRLGIERGELFVWEDDGRPVAAAGHTPPVESTARIAVVYTPPHARRHGYGAAVTYAASKAALATGVDRVLLFTDLANPTSNSIYQAIGYRPVADYAQIVFG